MSVIHIWKEQALITKATYHTINISPTEAEFFAIRYGISQAVCINNITNIVVVTDAISAAQKIFNTSCHLFQLYSIAISQDLRVFFSKNPRNSITFWDCPSNDKWPSHQLVDKESKTSKFHPILPSVKDVRSGSGVTQNGVDLLWSRRELTTKVGEQSWPQLVCCASIYCHVCGCVFQEDWIVARSFGEEWYRLIGVRIEQGEDVNDFNLWTKKLECNYWSTYTKSGIGGVLNKLLYCVFL